MEWRIFYTKLTLDEKLECVLLHLNDNVPLYTVSKERGIDIAKCTKNQICTKIY